MATNPAPITVQDHLAERAPELCATYDALLKAARRFGPVIEDPKKTSIHFVRETAFAGIAFRKSALVLTLKAAADIKSPRVSKHEQTSAHRWHLEVRLEKTGDVDRELIAWLGQAYELSAR